MKKPLLIGLCLLWGMQNAFTQNTQLHMGLEVGIVQGSLQVPPRPLTSSFFAGEIRNSLGPRIGLNIRSQLKSMLSLKTGIYYTQKGAASLMQPSPFGGGGILILPNKILKFGFIQVPIMLRFHPPMLRGFYLGMGPYGGILISHPHRGFENRPGYIPRTTFDLGFAAAIGQEIPIHQGNYLAWELRFESGTHDMSRFSGFRISEGSMLPRALNFGITYFLQPQ